MATTDIVRELRPFFYPGSIAVVGVSQDPSRVGSCMYRAIKQFGFPGKIYPVSPRLQEFMGEKSYPAVTAIPDPVDLAYLCVPAAAVPTSVRECIEKKIPAVIVFSSGFGETGTEEGKKLEAELATYKGKGTRIIGPNCFGVYCPKGKVTQIPGGDYARESGQVGLVSQSGGMSEDFCRISRTYGFYLSQGVSYGNAVDVTEYDILQYLEADPETKIIAAYIEGPRRGRDFFETIKRLAKRMPVIMWKGGLTPTGNRVVSSHTASLSGTEQVWATFFKQTGATPIFSLEEWLDTTAAFAHLPALADPRVSVICGGGGVSVAASDASYRSGLEMPLLDKTYRDKIAAFLPPVGSSARNPIDVGVPFPPHEMLEKVVDVLATSGSVGTVIFDKIALSVKVRDLLDYTSQESWVDPPWLEEIPVRLKQQHNIPIMIVMRQGGSVSYEEERQRLVKYYQANHIPVYPTIERAMKALGHVVRYYRWRGENK